MNIKGRLVDIPAKRIYPAEISILDKKIKAIRELNPGEHFPDQFICPGFIDAHVHIESSMLLPAEFARMAVVHGTIATVSDPHEIANVLGKQGVEFMIENGRHSPFYFYFGAPSCVPATIFETAGASLNATEIDELLARPEIKYLSEMMNYPGVLAGDSEVLKKIAAAKKYNKPVDGHAPGLRGEEARKYIKAGISTDHECYTAAEALDKLSAGMKILIREGSAARNFEALADLIHDHWEHMMFCSDDKHPDSLLIGHINQLCARAIAKNIDIFKVLSVACLNPFAHYRLDCGQLRPGDPADFILLKDLVDFEVVQTWLQGQLVAEKGKSLLEFAQSSDKPNRFEAALTKATDFAFPAFPDRDSVYPYPVIEAFDGQLITGKYQTIIKPVKGLWVSDPQTDLLNIIVLNRYAKAPMAKAFIKNFGIKTGAIASSVAHDSHNIVAVGTNDDDLCRAINVLIREKGGICVANSDAVQSLSLPVAGLMSLEEGHQVAETYTRLDAYVKDLGSNLTSPWMTLSFMALLVIPHLKLSDQGLFDGDQFQIL